MSKSETQLLRKNSKVVFKHMTINMFENANQIRTPKYNYFTKKSTQFMANRQKPFVEPNLVVACLGV